MFEITPLWKAGVSTVVLDHEPKSGGRTIIGSERKAGQADVHLRFRAPAVFTAHDLIPRRTAGKRDLWRRLLHRFDAVVVHSERGRETLSELGVGRLQGGTYGAGVRHRAPKVRL